MKRRQKMVAIALSSALAPIAAAQQTPPNVILDGRPVTFMGQQPHSVNGQMMIPFRGILEATNASVDWDNFEKMATSTGGRCDIEIRIGDKVAILDGEAVVLDAAPIVRNGRTLVPLSFVETAFNAESDWPNQANAIALNSIQVQSSSEESLRKEEAKADAPANRDSEDADLRMDEEFRAAPEIRSVYLVGDAMLEPGETLTVHATGAPYCQVEAYIDGVNDPVAMYEMEPGHYVGTWTPGTDQYVDLSSSDVTVIFSRQGYDSAMTAARPLPEAYKQNWNRDDDMAGDPDGLAPPEPEPIIEPAPPVYESPDTDAPVISDVYPTQGSRVPVAEFYVSAQIADNQSGIAPDFQLLVNGVDHTQEAKLENGTLTWEPMLSEGWGNTEVTLTTFDKAGNKSDKTWSFRVIGRR